LALALTRQSERSRYSVMVAMASTVGRSPRATAESAEPGATRRGSVAGVAADGCAEPSAAGVVEARFFSSTGLSDGPSRSCSRPCRAWTGPVLPGAVSGCALPAGSGSVGGTGADHTPTYTSISALSHIMLCLDCIWTTTSCDRGEDFCPDRQHLLVRSRGCRRSWNTSRQDRPERTYEAQITPARRVGARSGAHLSLPRAITLRTTHVPRHHCRRPPVIPGEVASPEPWKPS